MGRFRPLRRKARAAGRRARRAWRRTRPHALAYASGALLLLGGGAGSAAFHLELTRLAGSVAPPGAGPLLDAVRFGLLLAASLGGVSVLLGGFLAQRRRPRWASSLLISVGAGIGLVGVALHVAALLPDVRGVAEFVGTGFTTLSGLGTLLAVLAQVRLLSRRRRAPPPPRADRRPRPSGP